MFHNEYNTLSTWCRKFFVSDQAVGRVSAKLGFRGPFYDVMDLHQFPFDRQVLHIVIACDEPITQMEYCLHPDQKPNSILLEDLAEWKLDNSHGIANRYVRMWTCVRVSVCVCVCVCVRMWTCMWTCVWTCVGVRVCAVTCDYCVYLRCVPSI